jgi:hypothetical protein
MKLRPSASSRSLATPNHRNRVDGTATSVTTRTRATISQKGSIHEAEVDQLSTFIKKRSQALDEEINDLQQKLKTSSRGREALTTHSTSKFQGTNRTSSIENDPLQSTAEFSDLRLDGTGLGKVQLQPARILQESRKATPQLAASSKLFETQRNYQPDTDQLVTFLAKLKLSKCCYLCSTMTLIVLSSLI